MFDGYGEQVMTWIERTEREPIEISADQVFPLLFAADEYIEHGTLWKHPPGEIEIGVFDSTWLFLRCPAELADEIAAFFTETKIVAPSPSTR